MTRSSLLAVIAALCIGTGWGFWAGSKKAVPPESARPEAARSIPSSDPVAGLDGSPAEASRPSLALETPASRFGAAADPGQTLALLRAEANPNRQRREMDELCASLDVPRLQAFLAALGKASSVIPFERDMIEKLLGRWAELEPQAAADYAISLSASQGVSPIQPVLRIWAANDPAAAKAWALAAPNRDARRSGISAIISVLAEDDAQSALAFLDELPPTENKNTYINSLFQVLARKNTAEAATLATQITSLPLRQTAIEQVAAAWGRREPGHALAWLVQHSSPQSHQWQPEYVVRNILQDWVRSAPEEATAFAEAQPPGAVRSAIIAGLGTSWGAVDPDATAAWLQSLPKSAESTRAFQGLISSWAQQAPARAGDFILSLPADRSRDQFLQMVGSSWANQDSSAALAWARPHRDPTIDRLVGAPAAATLAAKDLPNADRYLAQLKTPEAVVSAISQITSALSQRDPEGAAQWVMQRPPTLAIERALESSVEKWTAAKPEEVGAWLNQQPAGVRKDTAVGAFATKLAEEDGAAAALWANTISDAKSRQQKLRTVVSRWASKESASPIRAWVEAQRFPAAERQELLQVLDRKPRR